MATDVYTDGACLGNPGPGGWAWAVVPGGAYASGPEALTTNQRMEVTAVLEALRALDGPLCVRSDSTYVVNCFRDRWWEGWLARGWLTAAKKPVANRDLWEPLIEAWRPRSHEVEFRWVKGHSGDAGNDLADRLAVEAARTQEGRSGTGEPAGSGGKAQPAGSGGKVRPAGPGAVAPDDPGGGADPRVPAGRRIAVVGHRPPELGGYGADNPTAGAVRRRLAEVLAAKKALHADAVVLTGLGLGAEQLGAEAAAEAGVPYVAVLAFPDQESVWPPASQERYRALLDGAAGTVLLAAKAPGTKARAGAALARRDAWLARATDEAVAVWDGEEPAVARLVRSLRDHLGEEEVWVLSP